MVPALLALLATAVVIAAAYGLGRTVFGPWPQAREGAEGLALSFVAGAGLLGLILFLVGLLSFGLGSVLAIVTPCAALGIVHGRRAWVARQTPWPAVPPTLGWFCATGILALLTLASLSALAGDSGHDGIAYHVLGPALWLRTGSVAIAPDEIRTAFPATVEALFGAGMVLSNDRSSRLLGVAFLLAAMVQCAGIARRMGASPRYSALAAALMGAMPVVSWHSIEAFVDVPFATFSLAALWVGLDMKRPRDALLTGALLGFAVGTKYTGLLVLAVTLAVVFVFLPRSISWRDRMQWSVVAALVAGVVAIPWYIHTYAAMGSPIYPPPPGLSRFVVTPHMPPDVVAAFHRHTIERGVGAGTGLAAFFGLPITFTFFSGMFHGAGGLGVAPLALGPVALLARRRDRFVQALVAWNLALVVLWFVTTQEARYITHVAICLAAFAACGTEIILQRARGLARVPAYAAITLSIAYGSLYLLKGHAESIAAVFSPSIAERRLTSRISFRPAINALNSADSVGTVLLADPDFPGYYVRHPHIKVRGLYGELGIPGVTAVADALRQRDRLGLTHVMALRSTAEREALAANTELEVVFESPDAIVFRFRGPVSRKDSRHGGP